MRLPFWTASFLDVKSQSERIRSSCKLKFFSCSGHVSAEFAKEGKVVSKIVLRAKTNPKVLLFSSPHKLLVAYAAEEV